MYRGETIVKRQPEGVPVKVAHVPVVYQVPPLMTQPFCTPPVVTGSMPLPEGMPVPAGGIAAVVVEGGSPLPFGKYLIPVAGQFDEAPTIKTKILMIVNRVPEYLLYLG